MVRWSRQAQPCVRPQRLCGNTGSREDGNMRAEGERKGGKPAGKLDMGNEIDQAAGSPPHVTQAAKKRALTVQRMRVLSTGGQGHTRRE